MRLVRYSTAILAAAWYTLRYANYFQLSFNEFVVCMRKSINLGLCYTGFSVRKTFNEATQASKAAFLCSAYDIASDWRLFDPESKQLFHALLIKEVTPEYQILAMELYDKDHENKLGMDGLERGEYALIFVLGLMGVRKYYSGKLDVKELGILLQIVDDVLDYEDDVSKKEMNCLISAKRETYLEMLLAGLTDDTLEEMFSGEFVLTAVIRKAKSIARQYLFHGKAFIHDGDMSI